MIEREFLSNIGILVLLSILVVSFVLSYVLTGIWRSQAIKNNIVDVPNQRSSHSVPTPSGGGIAIVLVYLSGLSVLSVLHLISYKLYLALMGAGCLSAVVGFLDDREHIRAKWRLLSHLIAAVWAISWLGGFPPIHLFGHLFDFEWLGHGIAAIYLIWLLNLYNFMDGIDGIAGLEAVSVCLCVSILYLLSNNSYSDWRLLLLLAATVAGFLIWNFPAAKIFMGDSGSGFLGITLGILSIHSAWIDPQYFWGWLILLGVFVVDATVTLLRRFMRGEKIHEAHRSHAYQHASYVLGSHKKVTLIVCLINVAWLFPIALLVTSGDLDGSYGVLIGYSPLVWLSIRLNAGVKFQ